MNKLDEKVAEALLELQPTGTQPAVAQCEDEKRCGPLLQAQRELEEAQAAWEGERNLSCRLMAERDEARALRRALLAALEKAAIYTETKVEDLPPHPCCNFCLAPLERFPGWDPCDCDDGKEARGAIAAAKKGGA